MRQSARRRQRGASVIEFTLSLIVLIPLFLGTFVFGFRLVRLQQTDQITRDLAHMYSRGLTFTSTGATTEAGTLANQFGLTAAGQSVVVFSTIQIETPAMCTAATGNANCANVNLPVFVQQVAIGNATANGSVFGTPTSTGVLPATTGVTNNYSTNVTAAAQASSSWAQAHNFGTVLALNAGEVTYMCEMFNNTPNLSITGLTGAPQVYNRAIF